ncbi:MAG: tRNA pseudouridine(55) synthase TruB [Marinilabiliales bacterium]|nr:MAG: tRNA pseudouridine(55) synthase TruB [Marinilabiliales bacterium]
MFDFERGELILIDKPYRWTSHEVVHHVRKSISRHLGSKIKVGHAGTLDPLATGVLIILSGKYTKRMEEFQNMEKQYTGTFHLGKTTPSFDLETEPDEEYDISHISEKEILDAAKHFTGKIQQIPPQHSAVKIKGKRAYDYARSGEEVIIKSREIEIYSFDIPEINLPEISFDIKCSKGTYIRSVARDFGKHLHSGAHLSSLQRTAIGEYTIEDCMHPVKFREFLENIKNEFSTE